MNFARIGQDVVIWPLAKIVSPEVISIGDSVFIDDFSLIMGGKGIELGSFLHIGSFVSILGGGELLMESFSALSSGVRLYTGADDFLGKSLCGAGIPYPYRRPIRSFVHIGKHVTIGANAVILVGVTIGDGVAVGANSLIKEDCEPWMIYGGTPARVLKPRPRERILELEAQLLSDLYDSDGHYIPRSKR